MTTIFYTVDNDGVEHEVSTTRRLNLWISRETRIEYALYTRTTAIS